MKLSKYREDIDGLRAVAVMSVVIFHAGVSELSGGFIGVDVFYVISGYLITSLILKDFELERFSFSQFYARRVKRLLPAATALILATLVAGYFILTPSDYSSLAKSSIFVSTFVANFWFAIHSGYFDQSAEFTPLIHTWSLSVEEQYYLLYPALVYLMYQWRGVTGVKIFIIGLILVSLSLSITISLAYPNFSYYLLPTRAWQLSIGALLCFLPTLSHWSIARINGLQLICLSILVWGFFYISSADIYPGYLAIIPTLAAAGLIYLSESHSSWVKKLFSTAPVVWIGKISYSVYLWHWPIVVYYRIYTAQHSFSIVEILILIVASLVAGYLSYQLIEQRFRYTNQTNIRTIIKGGGVTILLVFAGLAIWATQGVKYRVPEEVLLITDKNKMWEWKCTEHKPMFDGSDESFCVVGETWNKAEIKGVIWGDSHAQHWAQLVDYEAIKHGMSLIIGPLKCPAYMLSEDVKSHYPKFPNYTEDCIRQNQQMLKWLSKNDNDVQLIILASAWSGHVRMHYNENFIENADTLHLTEGNSEIGAEISQKAFNELIPQLLLDKRKLLLIGDVPRPNHSLNECLFAEKSGLLRRRCENDYSRLSANSIRNWHQHSDDLLKDIAQGSINIDVILPVENMCDANECPTYINNEMIYMDGNHIRRNLNKDTVVQFSNILGLDAYFAQVTKELRRE